MDAAVDCWGFGAEGEALAHAWMQRRGWEIRPFGALENGRGPVLKETLRGKLMAPDFHAFRGEEARWVEIKHKSAMSWCGNRKYFVTGMDLDCLSRYLAVFEATGVPVWVFFVHLNPKPLERDRARWGEEVPLRAPAGLFGELAHTLFHRYAYDDNRRGKGGMRYWQPFVHLEQLATLAALHTLLRGETLADTGPFADVLGDW